MGSADLFVVKHVLRSAQISSDQPRSAQISREKRSVPYGVGGFICRKTRARGGIGRSIWLQKCGFVKNVSWPPMGLAYFMTNVSWPPMGLTHFMTNVSWPLMGLAHFMTNVSWHPTVSSDQGRSTQISPDQLRSAQLSSDQPRSAQISPEQPRAAQISPDQF